jgi:hypothetical protein
MACISPISIRGKDRYDVAKKTLVPCGYCHKCRQKYRRDWIFRLQEEAKDHVFKNMLTLTYDDQNIPIKPVQVVDPETGLLYGQNAPSLQKKDLQLFIKRLRQYQARWIKRKYGIPVKEQREKIRYFACGEYGTKTFRPHYHILIFGLLPEVKDRLSEVWNKGFVHTGSVYTDAAIGYCTKYLLKGKREKKQYLTGHPEPEFITMSRKPGIGNRFLNKAGKFNVKIGEHAKSSLLVRNNSDKWQLMPRYFKERLLPQSKYLDHALEELIKSSIEDFWKTYEKVSKKEPYWHYELEQAKSEIKQINRQLNNGYI